MARKQTKPQEVTLRQEFAIKPFYTTTEIRNLIGYNGNQVTKAFLIRMNIPCNSAGGKKDIWYLSDIQTYSPDFFNSLCEASSLNSLVNKKPKILFDDEDYTSSQLKNDF